jgi:hypothetical protein
MRIARVALFIAIWPAIGWGQKPAVGAVVNAASYGPTSGPAARS